MLRDKGKHKMSKGYLEGNLPSTHVKRLRSLPIVSIVVLSFGLTKSILRILKGNPQKGATMETKGRVYDQSLGA